MSSEHDLLVATGSEALAAGNWSAAREAFTDALGHEASAEALNGLGEALWWLGDTHASVENREKAYAAFRKKDDPVRAASIAIGLCVHYRANIGDTAVASGWLARAKRIVEDNGMSDFHGWLRLIEVGGIADPVQGETAARESLEFARTTEDLDLELCSMAQIGSSLIEQGRVVEGLGYLDEAMAGSLGGEGGSFETVVYTSCHMVDSCSRCAEFERAVQWIRAADRFVKKYGCPFLYVYCRTLYGAVLVATGDWTQAEEELSAALESSRESQPVLHASAAASLAELRLAQGRLEDAERAIRGSEDLGPAAPIVAALHLAREKPSLARSVTRRQLDVEADQLRRAELLELDGLASLGLGELDAAASSGEELLVSGSTLDCSLIEARGQRLLGRIASARGDHLVARGHLDRALTIFVELGMQYEIAQVHLVMARALKEAEPEIATSEGKAALSLFEGLGARGGVNEAAALLRSLGQRVGPTGARGDSALSKRESEVLALLAEGLSNPQIAERLYVSRKTVEHHVASILSKMGVSSRGEAAARAR